MDQDKVKYWRSKTIDAVSRDMRLVRGGRLVTPEYQQGIVEALLAVAGTMFAAQHKIPVDVRPGEVLGSAALNAMHDWLGASNGSN